MDQGTYLSSTSKLVDFISNKYEFTQDYCSANLANIKRFLSKLIGKPDLNYLEIGCFEGASLLFQFENILTGPNCRATVVDYLDDNYEYVPRLYSNLNKSGFKDRITLMKGMSQSILPSLKPDSFDLIMIDGDHSAKAVFIDIANAWPLLKVGGYLIFDDYMWLKNTGFPRDRRPELVIETFLDSFRDEIEIIDIGYQVCIKRIPIRIYPDYESVVYEDKEYDWVNKTLKTHLNRKIIPTSKEQARLIEKKITKDRQNLKLKSIFLEHDHLDFPAFVHNMKCSLAYFLKGKRRLPFFYTKVTMPKLYYKIKHFLS